MLISPKLQQVETKRWTRKIGSNTYSFYYSKSSSGATLEVKQWNNERSNWKTVHFFSKIDETGWHD